MLTFLILSPYFFILFYHSYEFLHTNSSHMRSILIFSESSSILKEITNYDKLESSYIYSGKSKKVIVLTLYTRTICPYNLITKYNFFDTFKSFHWNKVNKIILIITVFCILYFYLLDS